MKRLLLVSLIIIVLPSFVLSHEGEVHFLVEPTALPGSLKYPFDRAGDWLNINLFTVSTKQKQQKRLGVAEERLAELLYLAQNKEVKEKNLGKALSGYTAYLTSAEDMAEKIIFLDGHEIGLARHLEERTRLHEQALAQALGKGSDASAGFFAEALILARVQNENSFKFIVEKYQFTDQDIADNKAVVEDHIAIVEASLAFFDKKKDAQKIKTIQGFLREAKNFEKFGFHLKAYELVKKAKNAVY